MNAKARTLKVNQQKIKVMQSNNVRQPYAEVYPDTIDDDNDAVMMFWSNYLSKWVTIPDRPFELDREEWAAQWEIK